MVLPDDGPRAGCAMGGEFYNSGKQFRDLELFMATEEPFGKNGGHQKERQIGVDPVSVKGSFPGEVSFNFMVDPERTGTGHLRPPPILAANPKFLAASLPNSASSSPRLSPSLFRKKQRQEGQASPLPKRESHSSPRYVDKLRGSWRSKSCGDGRASAVYDEFDFPRDDTNTNGNANVNGHGNANTNSGQHEAAAAKAKDPSDKEFKCGAFCLFLPGLGKGKPVRPRKEEAPEADPVVSRTVSMEKFECGSWASSAIMTDGEDDGDSKSLYFDLPLELIKSGMNEASSPVSAAFIFDKERKGVLKSVNTRETPRKSHESARRVRFSVSSSPSSSPGSCVTPRLLKAREDFNAYLEAQSAC